MSKTTVKDKVGLPGLRTPQADILAVSVPQLEWIDADLAKRYLAVNHPDNRNLDPKIVTDYARDMRAGNWLMLGDPLRFDTEGRLIDGQHRLESVKLSGQRVPFMVLRGIAVESIFQIDTGKSRTPADTLKIAGFRNATLRAGALRWLRVIADGAIGRAGALGYRMSRAELVAMAQKHPRLQESLGRFHPIRGISPSMVAALHYVGDVLLDQGEVADGFVTVLNTGVPSYEDDPAHKLRERLVRDADSKTRLTPNAQFAAMVHAFNNHRKGIPVQALRIPNMVHIDGLDPSLI